MKQKLLILKPIIILTIAITFVSCKWGSTREEPKGKNIICMVDFSHSKNSNQRLLFYMNTIEKEIFPKLNCYDKILVIPIDNASITNTTDIFADDFSKIDFEPEFSSPMEEEKLTMENLKKYQDSISNVFRINFNSALSDRALANNGTDIFGAIDIIKSRISANDDNYLIFFSDMMNYTKSLNMEPSNTNFNSSMIDKILLSTPVFNQSNITVLVLTGEQVEVTLEHFTLVKKFWVKYFEKNNIKLFDYNSASLSKLKELMDLPISVK